MYWRALATLLLAVACADPVHQARVQTLGPEAPGTPEGPLHRPGQPCNVCHGGLGPGVPTFSLAGTVYKYPSSHDPLPGALVRVLDAHSRTYETATNCAGNFFVPSEDFEPVWPVWIKLSYDDLEHSMDTAAYREGSCARCHSDPPGPSSAGHVYFVPDGFELPESTCP